jgi:hypothetical protein
MVTKQLPISLSKFPPFIRNFGTTSIFKAFILNALAVSLISTFTVEIRKQLSNVNSYLYRAINSIFKDELSEKKKTLIVAISSFFAAIMVYLFMFLLLGFGGGMLTPERNITLFRDVV